MRPLKPTLLASLVAALGISNAHAQNLPVLSSVVNGTAAVNTNGTLMTVTNSANAIIDWNKFSIGAGFTTNFVQPNAASSVLNRVVGADLSNIFGNLTSNGKVFLINPNGIVFGQGAQINVGALVASTVPLSNANFLAGNLNFGALPAAGDIQFNGNITAVDSVSLTATNLLLNGATFAVTGPGGTVTITSVNNGTTTVNGTLTVNSGNLTINAPGAGIIGAGAGAVIGPGLPLNTTGGNASTTLGLPGVSLAVSGVTSSIAGQISLAATNLVSLTTTTAPGIRFLVPLTPSGGLGSAINAQGQIGLLGNRAFLGSGPIATTAVVEADGTVRLTAKKSD